MLSKRHSCARCRVCGAPLFYGLETEPTGWKVQYICPLPEGCGRELSAGRIDRSDVDSEDEAYEQAAALGSLIA
jgi:hypothetical protein